MAQTAVAASRPRIEAERLTVFGAHTENAGANGSGAARAMIAAAVVVFLGVGAFASGAFGPTIGAWFGRLMAPQPTAQFTAPQQPQVPTTVQPQKVDTPNVDMASLDRPLTDEDAAVLDALRASLPEEPLPEAEPTLDDLRAAYAVSGIWPVAPKVPSPPPLIDLDNLYETSIDPVDSNFEAVALPALASLQPDETFLMPASPAPAGTTFALDDRGMVVPTPQGALNPDGISIYAGAPPVRQPGNLLRVQEPGEDLSLRLRLAAFRPQARPDNLIETTERAAFSGLTRSELGQIRPKLRPQSEQENALAAASLVQLDQSNSQSLLEQPQTTGIETATARAVSASLRPDARPNDFNKIVARAQRSTPAPTATAAVRVAPAPRAVAPKIPSSASASREATVKNAINLRKVNLIGVYGKPSSRRALVRLGNGRYQKVKVGDRIDGGRVSAIGDSELRYQKSGRAVVLKMPKG